MLNQSKYSQNVPEKTSWATALRLNRLPMTAYPTKDPMYFQFSEEGILFSLTFCFFFFLSFSFFALFDFDLLLDFLDAFAFLEFFFEASTKTKQDRESLKWGMLDSFANWD